MKYVDYLKVKDNGRKYVIGGSFFTYKGVQYGKGTKLLYTFDFHKRALMAENKNNPYWRPQYDYRMDERYYTLKPVWFDSVYYKDGKAQWVCGMLAGTGVDVVPDRDFKEILIPVYYVEPPTPKELRHTRLHDGTWFDYIGYYIIIYVLWLLFSLISYQWLTSWILSTIGLIWISYHTLSQP